MRFSSTCFQCLLLVCVFSGALVFNCLPPVELALKLTKLRWKKTEWHVIDPVQVRDYSVQLSTSTGFTC